MLALHLTHLHYTQLNSTTWCATAQASESLCLIFEALKTQASWLLIARTPYLGLYKFAELNWQYYAAPFTISAKKIAYNQRQLQRKGVRLLLQKLLSKLKISDTLDESDFPYQLIDSKYYVCFSHTSGNTKISASENPVQALSRQLNSNVAVVISRHRPVGIDIENNNIAWRVAQRFYSDNEIATIQSLPTIQRNSIIKLLWQIKESFIKIRQYMLAQGLGMDYAYLINDLIEAMKNKSHMIVIVDYRSDYHVTVLPIQQTVVIF